MKAIQVLFLLLAISILEAFQIRSSLTSRFLNFRCTSSLAARTRQVRFDPATKVLVPVPKDTPETVEEPYNRKESPRIQNYPLTQLLVENPDFHTTVSENRRNLAYPSQRLAIMMLFRKMVRGVREGLIEASPEIAAEFSNRRRIKFLSLLPVLKFNHGFRERVMVGLGLPKHMKVPAGMDERLFLGEVDFDVSRDILLQNIYVSDEARDDVKAFFEALASHVADMTVVYF